MKNINEKKQNNKSKKCLVGHSRSIAKKPYNKTATAKKLKTKKESQKNTHIHIKCMPV